MVSLTGGMHPKHKHNVRSRSRSRSRERHRESRPRHRSRSRSKSPIRVKEETGHKHSHRVHHDKPEERQNERPRAGQGRFERNNKLNHRERHRQKNKPEPVRIKQERPSPPTNANAPSAPKEKPNFLTSGKLAEDTNIYNGVVIKYNEPPEARKPKRRWRLYPFKGDDSLPMLPIHRQSAYLLGRERRVADIPIDHPSCSKQHAALQYRLVKYERDDGTIGQRVRPYIIDLESANGTFVNNQKIEPRRYVELMEKDVVKFGFSSREYVILHEESKEEIHDDDVIEDSPPPPEGEGGDSTEAATTSGAREAA